MIISIIAEQQDRDKRLDTFVSEKGGISRSYAQNIIAGGFVELNGNPTKSGYKLRQNDTVRMQIPEPELLVAKPQQIDLDIVYEDSHLLVVNKPQGMVVHPAAGNYEDTLVNALLNHCKGNLSSINGVIRPGIVHRIDKDTSGLLLVAKNDSAHVSLAAQIKQHSITRKYEAIVCGALKQPAGTIDLPIGRSLKDRKKMSVYNAAMSAAKNIKCRQAVTHFKVLNTFDGLAVSWDGSFSYVELVLETGRTHQIRVHLSHIGHPVLGDPVYGNLKKNMAAQLNQQLLHAKKLGFVHPVTGEYMQFESSLPTRFAEVLNLFALQEKIINPSNVI